MTKDELKIGIALSGGGMRAAVFHLGVLGRLAEDGLLEKITRISTVSGGTLVTGLIYSIAEKSWPMSNFFLDECLVQARRYLTETDIQRGALFRGRTRPGYLIQKRAKLLSKSIQDCWKISGNLNDIPSTPRWILNATTYETGKNWRFIPQLRMGDYVANYVEEPSIPLADAMTASAAYPILIGPLVLDTEKFNWFRFEGQVRESVEPQFKKFHLWDGGVYDNLGVEALFKIGDNKYSGDCNFLIVSDAANPIEIKERSGFFLKRAYRLVDIAMDQVRSLRTRTLVDHFEPHENLGVYFKIGNTGRKIILEAVKIDDKSIEKLTRNSLSLKDAKFAEDFETTLGQLEKYEYDLLYRHGWEVANFTLQARYPDLFQHKEWKD